MRLRRTCRAEMCEGVRRLPAAAAALLVVLVAAAVLAAAAAPAVQAGGKTGLVRGVVVTGPMTPVDPGAGPAWPRTKAVVRIFRHGGDQAVRTLRTGADGVFCVRLPAGTWRFAPAPAGPSTLPIPHDAIVHLRAGTTKKVRLWLDTGLQFPSAGDAGQTVEATATPGGRHEFRQGVLGTTRRGPIVPTVRPGEPSDAPCDATLVFYRPDGTLVATVHSTKEAGFEVSLPAGPYIVDPHSTLSSFDRAGPFTLKVPAAQWLGLSVWFDTGIRFGGAAAARF